jgi:uncharacterized protein
LEALAIMRKAGCSNGVIEHCINVTDVAMRLAKALREKGCNLDLALVEAGALLHDLGRAKTHCVEHGAVGGMMARELGLPEALARIIERHVGAGIPPEEAEELGLPEGDYMPETLEEKVVCYADKLIEGDREVDFEETVRQFEEELGEEHPSVKRMRALHEEMLGLLGSGPCPGSQRTN